MSICENETDLIIEVKRETETKLVRRWITVIDVNDDEMFKRRSVILSGGMNNVSIRWQCGKSAIASRGAIYLTETSPSWLVTSEIIGGPRMLDMNPGDTATLNWNDLIGDMIP